MQRIFRSINNKLVIASCMSAPVEEEKLEDYLSSLVKDAERRWLKAYEILQLLKYYHKSPLQLESKAPENPKSNLYYKPIFMSLYLII